MGKIYEDMYQAYLVAQKNWDNEAAYAMYAAAVKKYLGANKFEDGLERGKITVELTRRRIHEKGFVSTPGDLDMDPVADERETEAVRLDDVGAGPSSDVDGHSAVSPQPSGTPQLDGREEPGRATAPTGDRGDSDRDQRTHQSLGSETICDPLQRPAGQSERSELSRSIVRPFCESISKGTERPSTGDSTKGVRKDTNTKDKRVRRRKSNAQASPKPTT